MPCVKNYQYNHSMNNEIFIKSHFFNYIKNNFAISLSLIPPWKSTSLQALNRFKLCPYQCLIHLKN